ncbi:restriction endonuclease subunit S, partial [Halomonas urmiana]
MREGWKELKVGDVVEKIETIDPKKSPKAEFSYIDVSSVSRKFLKVTESSKVMGRDAPSRARRVVKSGDVIFATIRPGLKRVAEVPQDLDGAVCSTGFFVARGCHGINGRFLFYWFLSDGFSLPILRLQRGAAYPAVSDSDVRRQTVLVPPPPEQKRIVAILDEVFEGIDTVVANTEKKVLRRFMWIWPDRAGGPRGCQSGRSS